MSRQGEAVLFSTTQRYAPVFRLLRERGIETDGLLAGYGLSEAQLLDPRTRVPREIILHLARELALVVPNSEAIGIQAAAHFRLTDLGLLGYLLRHSEHVLGALRRFARYSRLMADAADCFVQEKPGRVELRVGVVGARPYTPQGVDYTLALLLVGIRELTQPPIRARAVRLTRPKPRDGKPFRALFGARIEFDAPHNELVFDSSDALVPAIAHDPQLLAILEHQAQSTLAELPSLDSLVEQVREAIAAGLDCGMHGSEHVAKRLGTSVRTLRRRLEESGNSHRSLLDQLRRERAVSLVADGELSIVEIAQRVGYSDPSAFATAFRRWTGRSPRATRATRR